MEANQIEVGAGAVFGHLEQVEDAEEAGLDGHLVGDVRQADGRDGLDLDVAVAQAVSVADFDVRAGPDADAGCDLAADDAVAESLGEDHGLLRYGWRHFKG